MEPIAEKAAKSRERALIEELLGAVMVPGEARRAADNLFSALIDLEGIFAAPEATLQSVPGMTSRGARLLRVAEGLAAEYRDGSAKHLRYVYDTPSAAAILGARLRARKTEAVALLLLDPRGRVVFDGLLTEGSFEAVPLHLPQVLQLCIVYQAAELYLAHNHPSGLAAPSRSDVFLTDRLLTALGDLGVGFTDHLIFGGGEEGWYSFKEDGLMQTLRVLVEDAQNTQLKALRALGERYRDEEPGAPHKT